jgi:hypothetical protein
MQELKKVVNQTFVGRAESTIEEARQIREEFRSEMDCLLSTLRRPENRELLRFAISWSKFERELCSLEQEVEKRLHELRDKETNPFEKFVEQLRGKN